MSFKKNLLILMFASLLLAGCAGQQKQTGTSEGTEPQADTAYEIEPWDGDGMEIPLDGSSREAWDQSMARVKAHTSESDYTTLENAIDYLLVYDLQAKNDLNNLISRLDGMTGYEILARVKWRKPAPGKGPAEKGAADAKIIDA